MCLLLIAVDTLPDRRWLLLGNRDEFHARASAPAQAWADAAQVIGGRDLQAGGSWLALHRSGRFAAVTNIRTGSPPSGARSRGELVSRFVLGAQSPQAYAHDIAAQRHDYGPFNLVVGAADSAWGVSSAQSAPWALVRGVHALSNGPPTTQWPKTTRLRAAFDAQLQSGQLDDARLLGLLADRSLPADHELPDTGIGVERERFLAPVFIAGESYGTRASTLAYGRADGGLVLQERRFGAGGVALGESRIET